MANLIESNEAPAMLEDLGLPQALQVAVILQQDNRLAEAEQLFCRILETAPDYADALHYYGVLKHFQQDTPAAIALIERSLAVAPDYLQAHNNLGNIYLREQQYEKAEQAYRKVLALDPEFAVAYNNLGLVYKALGRNVEAIDTLIHSIQSKPFMQMHYQNLGNVFRQEDEYEDAMADYLTVLAQRPFNAETYRHLSMALYLNGDRVKAAQVLRQLLESQPDDAMARHMVSAYSGQTAPERASDEYVRQTFDRFAGSFDSVLRQLDYQAPFLVEKAIREISGLGNNLAILDAGCGTGLCGPLLQPWAGFLVGVDLSAQMLERAARRGVYAQLAEAELTAFLSASPAAFDIIVSADTLCYFGDLTAALQAASSALCGGGYIVFTLEKLPTCTAETPYQLNSHGRYSHTQAYIEQSLAAAGLVLERLAADRLRMELDEPVMGFVVTAKKPI